MLLLRLGAAARGAPQANEAVAEVAGTQALPSLRMILVAALQSLLARAALPQVTEGTQLLAHLPLGRGATLQQVKEEVILVAGKKVGFILMALGTGAAAILAVAAALPTGREGTQ